MVTRRAPIEWPGGAKICVCTTIAFEGFRYASQYGHKEAAPGKPNHFSLSYGEYGPKVGVWRIFDILERQGLKATFDVGGLAAERDPEILKEMHDRGHEPAGHGYANDSYPSDEDVEGELRDMRATIKAIETATGARPVGWVKPSST